MVRVHTSDLRTINVPPPCGSILTLSFRQTVTPSGHTRVAPVCILMRLLISALVVGPLGVSSVRLLFLEYHFLLSLFLTLSLYSFVFFSPFL